MNEIYWITRLDGIHTVCNVFVVIAIFAIVFFLIGVATREINKEYNEEKGFDLDWAIGKSMAKVTKPFVILGVIALLANMFVPTTKEALLICGVGGAIDYVQSNETIKKLPDKAVEALDKYLDELNYERDKNSKTAQ